MRHARAANLMIAIRLSGATVPLARGVILYSSSTRNTAAPTGTLSTAGWQYQGQFGQFLGTPIAPHYFVTAQHIGGSVGQAFYYGGKTYTTSAAYDDPTTDLRIWHVNGTFSSFAPMYTG